MSVSSRSSNGRKAGSSGSSAHSNGVVSGPPAPPALSTELVALVQADDAAGLEAALAAEAERLAAGARKGKAKGGDPCANLKKRVLQYAAACDAELCIALLLDEEDVPIDCSDETGRTPLHHAALHHAKKAVQALMDRGAEGDETTKEGRTPLETALMSPRLHIAWTPHMQATGLVELMQNKDLSCLALLAQLVPASVLVRVAFSVAAEGAVPSLVALLLVGSKHIVNAVSRIADGAGAAMGTLVELLLRKALATSPGGADKLATAALGPRVEREVALKALEVLLLWNPRLSSGGRDARAPDSIPVLRCARVNDAEVLRLLLEAGADVNESDAEGNSALHWCLRGPRGSLDARVVRRLLEHGASCTASNKLGATPLHTAAGHGHAEALRLLLTQEPQALNVLAATKETALHYAVKNGHAECVRVLLLLGANRSVVNVRNQRPADLAGTLTLRRLLATTDPALLNTPIPEADEPPRAAAYPGESEAAAEDGWQVQTGRAKPGGHPAYHARGATSPKVGPHGTSASGAVTIGIGGVQLDANNMPPAKTVLCKFFSSGQGCSWGSSCHFAHNKEELLAARAKQGLPRGSPAGPTHRERPKPQSAAPSPAAAPVDAPRAAAPAVPAAALQQTATQQDAAPLQDNRFLKTKLCVRFTKGGCPRGDKCTYAHGFGELRPWVEGEGGGSAVSSRPGTPASTGPTQPATPDTARQHDEELVDKKKVFVGGLPAFVEKDDLWSFFEDKFGPVADAMVAYFPNGASRGFGFVTFQHEKPAASAAKLHYLPFHGKRVEVKFAMPLQDRTSPSPGTRTSRPPSATLSPMPLPPPATAAPAHPPPLSLSAGGAPASFHHAPPLPGAAYAAVAAPSNRAFPAPTGPPSPSVGVVGQRGPPAGSYAAAAEQQRQAEQARRFEEHPHFQQPASTAPPPPQQQDPRQHHALPPGGSFEQARRYEQFPVGPRATFGNLEGFGGGAEDSGLLSELMSSLLHPEPQPPAQPARRGPPEGGSYQGHSGHSAGVTRQGPAGLGLQQPSTSGGNESLEGLCVVCWERKHACVAVPCGHRSLCIPCKEALQQSNADRDCPICRSTVDHWVAIPQG